MCVDQFDHHCPWVGTCIGKRNYGRFLCFISSVWGLCAFVCWFGGKVLVVGVRSIALETGEREEVIRVFLKIVREYPLQITAMVVTTMSFVSLTSLVVYHIMLISKSETTNERVRKVYERDGVTNISNTGSFLRNFQNIFFKQSRTKSRIGNLSTIVKLDTSICLPCENDSNEHSREV